MGSRTPYASVTVVESALDQMLPVAWVDSGLGRGGLSPVVLDPASVPVVTEVAVAEQETELAILSAVAHGNGPEGLDVVQAVLSALGRFDQAFGTARVSKRTRAARVSERTQATLPPVASM